VNPTYPNVGSSIGVRHTAAFESLTETLKVAVATLNAAEVPFVLGGSLAAWARGGPEPQNDLDLMVKPEDAEAALQALAETGMRPERPPEEWLFKAWHGDVMIDLIFQPSGLEMTDEVFQRADTIPVLAVATPVMAIDDVLATKLMALTEHSLDYSSLLAIARAVREQVDWAALRARTSSSPYAQAFFTLVERLGIAPVASKPHSTPRVRVVEGGA
jgi:Uncharacterised nucleotidyltransferase